MILCTLIPIRFFQIETLCNICYTTITTYKIIFKDIFMEDTIMSTANKIRLAIALAAAVMLAGCNNADESDSVPGTAPVPPPHPLTNNDNGCRGCKCRSQGRPYL